MADHPGTGGNGATGDGGPATAAEVDVFGLDLAPVGGDARDAATLCYDASDRHVLDDLDTLQTGALGQRHGGVHRRRHAVGRDVQRADEIVGALENSKYADNTIILLWSDHGFQLGEKERWTKYSLWERATRVNMIWVAPGVTTPGAITDKPTNLLDIYPTLASLTGCEPPDGQLEGNDLTVLMEDPEASWDKTSLTTFGYKNYGVRSERHRYIVYENGTEELYDHAKDKWEWKNLADDPEYATIKKKMLKEIPTHHEPPGVTYVPPKRNFKSQ